MPSDFVGGSKVALKGIVIFLNHLRISFQLLQTCKNRASPLSTLMCLEVARDKKIVVTSKMNDGRSQLFF